MNNNNFDYIHDHPEIYFTQKAKNGGYVCTVCGNGSGKSGTGVKLIKGQTFRYKCFKCGTSGDVINFYAAEHNISNLEAIPRVFEMYGLDFVTKKFQPKSAPKKILSKEDIIQSQLEKELIANDIILAAEHLHETDYLARRGISHKVAEKYNCGYIEKWIHPKKRGDSQILPSPRVIIPTSPESYIARAIDDNKIPKMKAGSSEIFNIDILQNSYQNVVVVEGEFDALSIIEAGNDAIALGSTTNVDKFLKWLKEKNIQPHQPLVLNLDADDAGQKATDKLTTELRKMKIKFYEINLILKDCKDQNESLMKFREKFFQMVADIPRKVQQLQQDARYKLTDFAKIDTWEKNIRTGRKAISTGWQSLDQVLDGGLYEGYEIAKNMIGKEMQNILYALINIG